MVWKFLTNIRRIMDSRAVESAIMEIPVIATAQAQALMTAQVQTQIETSTLKTLDTASLMRSYWARYWSEILPALRPELAPQIAPRLREITPEEETQIRRTRLGARIEEIERFRRYTELAPEERVGEMERLRLYPDAVLRVENITQAMLENIMWTERQDQVRQCLQELLAMSEEKRRYVKPILGLEALQKQLMRLYVPFYMEQPYSHNMFGVVLSWMTLQELLGKSASIYASLAGQGQAIKQSENIMSATVRQLRTKAVALSKTMTKWWNTVHGLAETVNLELTKKIPLFTDFKGRPLVTVTLFQALGHRYLISKWFGIHEGFPEKYWFLLFPRLEVVVTRRGLRLHKRMRIPDWMIESHKYDEVFRQYRRWRGYHG